MNILAFDCSTSDVYLYINVDGKSKSVVHRNCMATELLVQKIDELLKEFKLPISKIDCIGVGVGPGSFTGSRVAVVTAKAFAAVLNLKIVAFNSFELLSYNGSRENVVRVVEGFSDFVYASALDIDPTCVTKSELLQMVDEDRQFVSRVKLLEEDRTTIADYNIANVVEDKVARGEFINVAELEPIYLRLSQAEIQLKNKMANSKQTEKNK